MFHQAQSDGKLNNLQRKNIAAWRIPLEYYFAGPGYGKKEQALVIIYAGGRRVVVDKPAYSGKVLDWAALMERS